MTNTLISIGISDLAGLEEQIELNFKDQKIFFDPGTPNKDIVFSGISAPITLCEDSCEYTFMFELKFRGSQSLKFVPMGKVTDANLKSSWSDPSFSGSFLPDDYKVESDNFQAHWNIYYSCPGNVLLEEDRLV